VRIVAPSGPFDRTLVWRALGWLSRRYRVEYSQGLFARNGYLAGTDERRLTELNEAFTEPGVRAVIAARGGYGLGRIVHRADFAALRKDPKWVVGFSDITALHAELTAAGVASLHAHNLAGMGRGDDRGRREWVRALESPGSPRSFTDLAVWRPGDAEGVLVGGNLTVLFTSLFTRRRVLPEGAVLLLEDVGEAPYRIDRMLTAMRLAGVFDSVSAVVFGEFTDCPVGRHGVDVERVLREAAAGLGVPVLGRLPIGHGRSNAPVHLGYRARLTHGRLDVETP
jgi:muramoyltetrapeptide carboxypeptidase